MSIKFPSMFRRTILTGLALALIALIFIDITAYQSSMEYTDSVDAVKRTYRILTLLNGTITDLVSAESELRGYVITADERYLSQFQGAARDVTVGLDDLQQLIIDPVSLKFFSKFDELSDARLARLKVTLEAMRTGGINAVRQVAGPGKELMDEFRRTSSLIENRQLELLSERERKSSALSQRSIMVILTGSTFAVLLLGISMLLLGQQLIRRERLEREVLEISEREQRHIGQDLHDGVCQQLTGISLLSRSLSQKLSNSQARDAAQITDLINECIEQVRRVTRGLHPVPDEPSGLMHALRELAERIGGLEKPDCRFVCPQPVPIPRQVVATNLYRIAQEAVQNAMRHAAPRNIEIELASDDQCIHLSVSDDGSGFSGKSTSEGMGLEIMAYRARAIRAALAVRRRMAGGTEVACKLPLNSLL
jgi:signal transduction histidine kinase